MERMNWLSRLASRGPGHRVPQGSSLQTPVMADPETCLMVFKNHWSQVVRILERPGPRAAPGGADDLSAVRNHTYQMLTLLAEDRAIPSAPAGPGPLLEFALRENLLTRVLAWQLQWDELGDGVEERRAEQLKLFEMLVSEPPQPLLRHGPVREALLTLLDACGRPVPSSPALDEGLVLLLSQLCVCLAREPSLLEFFLQPPPEPGAAPRLLLFSRLVPFVHREGTLGQQARDALLLLMALSAGSPTVGRYIADHSYFCPVSTSWARVLATGLSALYSSLPRKIEVPGDDWHCLRREDWLGVPALALFMSSLEFCNAVIQVAHPLVQKQLVDYIHNGFLVPVMGPALHKTSVEEMIASTAYLELFLRSISEPALLRTFLRFLLLHRHDTHTILDTLVARIGSNSRLCMVSLSLFRTLLNLSCEDVLLQLVLRYLVPCNHVMLSQKPAVRDVDLYGRAADKFLSLIPRCCRHRAPSPPRAEHASWARGGPSREAGRREDITGPGSPSVDSSSVVTVPRPSTPSRLALFLRQQSLSGSESPAPAPRSPGLAASPTSSPGRQPSSAEEPGELEDNYLEYLREARRGVDRCVRACRTWSAPYDGERPPPEPSPVGSRTKKRSLLPEEDRDNGGGREEEELGSRGLAVGTGEGPGHLPPPQLNGVPGPWPEGAKKVRLVPQEGAGDRLEGISEGMAGLEGFGQELRELEVALSNGGASTEPPLEPPLPLEEEEAYESFTCPPEPPGPFLSSPLRTLNQLPSQPFTGPFMAVLFAKLENMLQNSVYVNFLLTGLVAQLACHPQPLLRSFLLNTNMVFQPSVKSLLQVLGSVKNKIESFAASQEDFPALLSKAKKYLIARGKLDWAEGPAAVPVPRRSDPLVKSRRPSLGELLLRHAHSPTRARQAAQLVLQPGRDGAGLGLGGGSPGASTPVLPLRGGAPERQGEALRVKNAVYCAVIFPEFLKELAAISQAHAVTSPFLLDTSEDGSGPPISGFGPLNP
ncbi:FTS and Hook-interacting protein isoform X1 [Tupaia chinensis]|uniref:FTS and Hook-interacting protein isoform X1 n=1 Tax=Tupaia chinensis TaxID=246437 RepID=UPI00070418B7|nr:FTS and Hook-interacting protein isoform X1 [Tupaia chinensis]XP_014448523.1 FTS and Hook-interacting protein isoform X1 [Tupaia chinensis]XP_014448524.1 FTS and Hook-interacting protein isoform X1 [Tupaia chinensis]